MIRKMWIGGCAILLIIGSAQAQIAASGPATSYEMYSWKLKGHWYYSLLPRGVSKTYSDITTNPIVCRDSSGLTAQLRKLSGVREIFWMSDAPTGAMKPATTSAPSIKHPSRKRINHIKALCDKLGIRLKLA